LVPKIEYTGVKVNEEVATARAEFWTIANEADAVELHKDVEYPGKGAGGTRHFSVLLDMKRLADHPGFKEKCLEQLRKIEPPDLVLIPEHPNREVVERLCREVHADAIYRSIPQGPLGEEFNSLLA